MTWDIGYCGGNGIQPRQSLQRPRTRLPVSASVLFSDSSALLDQGRATGQIQGPAGLVSKQAISSFAAESVSRLRSPARTGELESWLSLCPSPIECGCGCYCYSSSFAKVGYLNCYRGKGTEATLAVEESTVHAVIDQKADPWVPTGDKLTTTHPTAHCHATLGLASWGEYSVAKK